jgi:teichuronic acid biosynthesis glycosyltransferase TuaH
MGESFIGQDFVIVGQQPWDLESGSNCKDIAIELSKHNRVLYVNSPLDRITSLKNRKDPRVRKRLNLIQQRGENLTYAQKNLWVYYPDCLVESINWISSTRLFDVLNKRNNRLFANSILQAVRNLEFKAFILFNDNEIFKAFYLNELLKPDVSIYYSRDNMIAVPYWRKHGLRLEPTLIEKNDFCFTNSEYLTNYSKQYNSRTFNIGQGFNLEGFQNTNEPRPKDLPQDKPLIGYVGALTSSRLNIELISLIAKAFPEAYVVLVGQPDKNFVESGLFNFENVLFLGIKRVNEVHAYIRAFDVCINPQLLNDITMGNYPRKIDEYLAFGKPTVATKTPTMVDFEGLVYLADSSSHFIELVRLALRDSAQDIKEARIETALSHSWSNSVSKMYSIIKDNLNRQI